MTYTTRRPISLERAGPFERIVSAVPAKKLRVLTPPRGASVKRMVQSLQWTGRTWGTIDLAEHLLLHQKLLERVIARSGVTHSPHRIDFLGSTRQQKHPVVHSDVEAHPVLQRRLDTGGWFLMWTDTWKSAPALRQAVIEML